MSQSREGTSSTARTLSLLRFNDDSSYTSPPATDSPTHNHALLGGKTITFIDDYESSPTTNDTPTIPAWRRKLMSTSALDNSFVLISSENRATKSDKSITSKDIPFSQRSTKELDDFGNGTEATTRSKHTTRLYHIKKDGEDVSFYFKENEPDSLMSELEALAVGFFRIISPSQFPPARAYVDEHGHYVGVSSKALENFNPIKKDPLTAEDLESISLVENLAVTLTTSYIFEEDDLHTENLSKTGERIDGDMLIWPILSLFKSSDIGGWLFRKPDDTTFTVTENDIRNFPDITDAHPFYWPTRPIPTAYKYTHSVLKAIGVSLSKDYPEDEIKLFKGLKNHPTFIHHKFKTLLKYILTDAKMYGKVAKMHLRDSITHNGENLIAKIVSHEEDRIQLFRNTLVNMPEFKAFVSSPNGQLALRQIIAEFETENKRISAKLEKLGKNREQDTSDNVSPPSKSEESYADLMVNAEEIKLRYREICADVFDDTEVATSRTWVNVARR